MKYNFGSKAFLTVLGLVFFFNLALLNWGVFQLIPIIPKVTIEVSSPTGRAFDPETSVVTTTTTLTDPPTNISCLTSTASRIGGRGTGEPGVYYNQRTGLVWQTPFVNDGGGTGQCGFISLWNTDIDMREHLNPGGYKNVLDCVSRAGGTPRDGMDDNDLAVTVQCKKAMAAAVGSPITVDITTAYSGWPRYACRKINSVLGGGGGATLTYRLPGGRSAHMVEIVKIFCRNGTTHLEIRDPNRSQTNDLQNPTSGVDVDSNGQITVGDIVIGTVSGYITVSPVH